MKKTNFTNVGPRANHDPQRDNSEHPVVLDDTQRAIIAGWAQTSPEVLDANQKALARRIDAGDLSPYAQQLAVAFVEAITEFRDAQQANPVKVR